MRQSTEERNKLQQCCLKFNKQRIDENPNEFPVVSS